MTTNLIATALPLVYRKDNEFEVLDGLDMNRKEELWGIQLLSGVMVALKCGPGNNVSATTWGKVKRFAEKMRFKGEPGSLPFKDHQKWYWGNKEEVKFAATVDVLEENGIEAEGYRGWIWCSEECCPNYAYYFDLRYGDISWSNQLCTNDGDRIAIAFN